MKNEHSLRNLWYNIKHTNISIRGVTEGEEKKQATQNLIFKNIMTEIVPKLMKEINIQTQEVQSPKQDEPKVTS